MPGDFAKGSNLLTVDLEEWFVVEALSERYSINDWSSLPSTVIKNSRLLLSLFDNYGARATWFVLGWVCERYPELIAEIASRGHEIACHSYAHRRVDSLSQFEFQEDTQRAIDAIEKVTGERPLGYRAPSWSMNERVPWAFETLARLGFTYDSSIFPIKHDLYGIPDGPRHFFRMSFEDGGFLFELPASTFRIFGRNLPIVGGGYLRHAPYWYSRFMVRRLNANGQPAVVYVHPWELDSDPPQISGLTSVQQYRMYGSTAVLLRKLEKLLSEFRFTTVESYIRKMVWRPIGFERGVDPGLD